MRLKRSLAIILFAAMTGSLATAFAQDVPEKPSPAVDNTKINQRDRNKAEKTADQQKDNPSDRELSRQIRKAIIQDKSLSTYAHNIKIIAQNGAITLKGPVRSEDEKQAVEAKAAEVAGATHVTSQLEVKPKN